MINNNFVLNDEQKMNIILAVYGADFIEDYWSLSGEWKICVADYDGDYEDFPYALLIDGYEFDRLSEWAVNTIKE